MTDSIKSPPTLKDLRARRQDILALAARYGATNLRVFGSVARGEATTDSDIDFMVHFQDGASLFEFSGFWQDLQELIGYEVNVISEGGLKTRFLKRIESDLVPL